MEQIEARILDRVYKLQVPGEERERLLKAVELVDGKMREIRDTGKAQGPDRIAVNAALQLVYEFLGREAAATAATTPAVALLSSSPTVEATIVAASSEPAAAEAVASDAAQPPEDGVASARRSGADARRGSGSARGSRPPEADKSGDRSPAKSSDRSSTVEKSGDRNVDRTADKGPGPGRTSSPAEKTSVKPSAGAGSGDPSDAEIERISTELEAEIRRQESLF